MPSPINGMDFLRRLADAKHAAADADPTPGRSGPRTTKRPRGGRLSAPHGPRSMNGKKLQPRRRLMHEAAARAGRAYSGETAGKRRESRRHTMPRSPRARRYRQESAAPARMEKICLEGKELRVHEGKPAPRDRMFHAPKMAPLVFPRPVRSTTPALRSVRRPPGRESMCIVAAEFIRSRARLAPVAERSPSDRRPAAEAATSNQSRRLPRPYRYSPSVTRRPIRRGIDDAPINPIRAVPAPPQRRKSGNDQLVQQFEMHAAHAIRRNTFVWAWGKGGSMMITRSPPCSRIEDAARRDPRDHESIAIKINRGSVRSHQSRSGYAGAAARKWLKGGAGNDTVIAPGALTRPNFPGGP